MRNKKNFLLLPLISLTLTISACGGGDGNNPPDPGPQNIPPTVSAGTDQTVNYNLPTLAVPSQTVTLSGSAADSDGNINDYNWTESSNTITIDNNNFDTASFTVPAVTVDTNFTFTLTVTDNFGATTSDDIVVTIIAPIPEFNMTSSLDKSNWTIVNRSPNVRDIAFTGSKYLAVGASGYIASSTDGLSWTEIDIGSTAEFDEIAVNGSRAVAIPRNARAGNVKAFVASTTDGTNWQMSATSTNVCTAANHITHDGTQFVGIFDNNTLCSSADGSSWALQSTQSSLSMQGIAFGGGRYAVLISNSTATITINEADLNTTTIALPASPLSLKDKQFSQLIYGVDKFIGIKGGEIVYLSDGSSAWELITGTTVPTNLQDVSYSTTKGYIAISNDNTPVLYTSSDGINWTVVSNSSAPLFGGFFSSIINGANESLLFTNDSLTYRSTDQAAWNLTATLHPADRYLTTNTFFKLNNTLLVNAKNGLLRSADNGANWSLITSPGVSGYSITTDGTRLFTVGNEISYSDNDGITWNKATDRVPFNEMVMDASVQLGSTTYTFISNVQPKLVLSSDDGITFQVDNSVSTVLTNNAFARVKGVVSGNGALVGITQQGAIIRYDGGDWTQAQLSLSPQKSDIVFNGTNFVVVGSFGLVMTSPDGITWTTQTWLNTTETISDVLVVGTDLYATDSSGKIAKSTDNGVTWVLSKDFRAATVVTNNTINELVLNSDTGTIYGFGTNVSNISPVTLVKSTDNGASWSVDVLRRAQDSNKGRESHVFYDAANSRFVTNAGFESTAPVIVTEPWVWTAVSQYPDDPSFSYIQTQADLADLKYGPVRFTAGTGGAADSYVSGSAAVSTDGLTWTIKTGQPFLTANYTPASGIFARKNTSTAVIEVSNDDNTYTSATLTGLVSGVSTLDFIKYVNGQYVGISVNDETGKTGFYTSQNGSDWSLVSEKNTNNWKLITDTNVTSANVNGFGVNALDIVHDGNQYLITYFEGVPSASGLSKGTMILKTTDLQNFTLFETGLRTPLSTMFIDTNGYILIGQEANIVTRNFYQ